MYYKLVDKEIIEVRENVFNAKNLWFTTVNSKFDTSTVSTSFLGIDHGIDEHGRPLLFETMVFGGHYDQQQWRVATYNLAERNHFLIVEMVKGMAVSSRQLYQDEHSNMKEEVQYKRPLRRIDLC